MKNIPVSLHRRKLLPTIPVLLYFINLQYVYRNNFTKNKFLGGPFCFFLSTFLQREGLRKLKKRAFRKNETALFIVLTVGYYKEDLLKMVITLPLISAFLTGPKSRRSFAPERMSDIMKYSPSFSLTGYFTASVS